MRISAVFLFFAIVWTASGAFAANTVIGGDGKLSLYNYHEREYLNATYREGGKYLPDGIARIKHLFRSRGDGTEKDIDLRLIELIDNIEDHFGADTVEIVSGYRSPGYNKSLITDGRGAAGESLHMQGLAADIHIDEVLEEDIFDYAKKLGAGGVGIYPKYAFVHVDVGTPRTWAEAPQANRILVGTQNNPNSAWSAITDRNIYKRGDEAVIRIKNNEYKKMRLIKNVWIEHYKRGEWENETKIENKNKSENLSAGESSDYRWIVPSDIAYGKYRFVIFADKDASVAPVLSNEFYVKK